MIYRIIKDNQLLIEISATEEFESRILGMASPGSVINIYKDESLAEFIEQNRHLIIQEKNTGFEAYEETLAYDLESTVVGDFLDLDSSNLIPADVKNKFLENEKAWLAGQPPVHQIIISQSTVQKPTLVLRSVLRPERTIVI